MFWCRRDIVYRWEKKSFKCGRIPIDPAILAAIGHRFIAKKKKKKTKNADARVWGDARGDQKLVGNLFCQ